MSIFERCPPAQAVLDAIAAKFPKDEQLDDHWRLAKAVTIIAVIHPDSTHPNDIYPLLRAVEGGYSCWLSEVENAIEEADLTFRRDPERTRYGLTVAMEMARIFIWGMEQKRPPFVVPVTR